MTTRILTVDDQTDDDRRRARRFWTAIGFAATSLTVGALVGVWAITTSEPFREYVAGPVTAEPIPGERAVPVAQTPEACPDPCLTPESSAFTTVDPSVFRLAGMPRVGEPRNTRADSTAAIEARAALDEWHANGNSPDQCAFTWSGAPVNVRQAEGESDDPVITLSSFESNDLLASVSRVVRIFPTADAASSYLQSVDDALTSCDHYRGDTGLPVPATQVRSLAALTLPNTVAAVSWAEHNEFDSDWYVADVQRSNVVIRVMVYTGTAETAEREVRLLAEAVAMDLALWPTAAEIEQMNGDQPPQMGLPPGDSDASVHSWSGCPSPCWTPSDMSLLATLLSDLQSSGFEVDLAVSDDTQRAGAALDRQQQVRVSDAQCRVTLSVEPVVRGNPTAGASARHDPIVELARASREEHVITMVGRVFESPDRARAYMGAVTAASGLCRSTSAVIDGSERAVTVTQAKVNGWNSRTDPIVAEAQGRHVGFALTGGIERQVHDILIGNVVVRVVFSGPTQPNDDDVSAALLPLLLRGEAP